MKDKKYIYLIIIVLTAILAAVVILSNIRKKSQKELPASGGTVATTSEEGNVNTTSASSHVFSESEINTSGPISDSVAENMIFSNAVANTSSYEYGAIEDEIIPINDEWYYDSYFSLINTIPDLYMKHIDRMSKYHIPGDKQNYIIIKIEDNPYILTESAASGETEYYLYSSKQSDFDFLLKHKAYELTDISSPDEFIERANAGELISPAEDQTSGIMEDDKTMWNDYEIRLENHLIMLIADNDGNLDDFGITEDNRGQFMYEAALFNATILKNEGNVFYFLVSKDGDANQVQMSYEISSVGDDSTGKTADSKAYFIHTDGRFQFSEDNPSHDYTSSSNKNGNN